MRLRASLVAIITSLGVVACGGSSHSSSTQATATPAASSQTTTVGSSTGATTATSSAGDTSTTTTTSTSAPPEVPKAKKQKHHGATHAASQGARVEAKVSVTAGGDITPPVVSVPSGVSVELHVTNHGSASSTVALSVPSHPSVRVAPGATGTLHTAGLKDGTYQVLVNGTPRGQLMIGAQGGP